METNDRALLRQYAERHLEEAFATLVRRHVNLVYSVALRRVQSSHLAEEVSQSVFTDLARNADKLRPNTVLGAWLHSVAYRTAIDVVRGESRRQFREQKAMEMAAMDSVSSDWSLIEDLLDEGMDTLDETDRSAIVLRYFENKSLREVGATLGTSDDAAQKRVSRAVERLREFFTKRGVTVGASGLVVVISSNAVQAAPVGLAAAISSAVVVTGTAVTTATTTATITKAIAMTALQKTLITATIVVTAGAGIYEARQASALRSQLQTIQQQEAGQIRQLQQGHDDAMRQLTALRDENENLNRDTTELLKLRDEVARLRNAALSAGQANPTDASTSAAAELWLARVNQLKQYVDQHPNEKIPEFQFLTDGGWLSAAAPGPQEERFEKEDDYRRAMESLRFQAQSSFLHLVQAALNKYSQANSGQFPADLSQLRPYCEPSVEEMLLQLYEIKPADILPESTRKDLNVKVDWVVTRIKRVNSNSTSRLAVFPGGESYWQSPLGTDDP